MHDLFVSLPWGHGTYTYLFMVNTCNYVLLSKLDEYGRLLAISTLKNFSGSHMYRNDIVTDVFVSLPWGHGTYMYLYLVMVA